MIIRLGFQSLLSKKPWTMELSVLCTFQRLKEEVSRSIFGHSANAHRLRFSLNGKEEFSPPPDDHLLSIGLTSGEIIFYGFSPPEQDKGNAPSFDLQHSYIYPHQIQSVLRRKEIDHEKVELNRFSEPYLLKRVLCEETGSFFTPIKLVIAVIHAVFSESGCVGFDSVSGLRVDLIDMLKNQASMPLFRSFSYTVSQLLSGDNDNDNDIESVVLKFRNLGTYLIVYGSLAKSHGSRLHKLHIDVRKYVDAIDSFWVIDQWRIENLDSTPLRAYAGRVKVVLELWKYVKDGLVLPLLIDLCEKTGLDLPPCLTHLPADVKRRILQLMPGQDIARVAGVCRELKDLSDDDELWKEKYMAVFGSSSKKRKRGELQLLGEETNWKAMFASSWEKKTNKREGGSNLLWTAYPYHVFGHPRAVLPKETGMPPPKYTRPCKPISVPPPISETVSPYGLLPPGIPTLNPISLGHQILVYELPYMPPFGFDPHFKDKLPLPPLPPLPRISGSARGQSSVMDWICSLYK